MLEVVYALALALDNAGSNMAARIPMMAMTTSSSISVNPLPPARTVLDDGDIKNTRNRLLALHLIEADGRAGEVVGKRGGGAGRDHGRAHVGPDRIGKRLFIPHLV